MIAKKTGRQDDTYDDKEVLCEIANTPATLILEALVAGLLAPKRGLAKLLAPEITLKYMMNESTTYTKNLRQLGA